MYLSKLELHGFKSFADRTALQFDPGITSVVGPNGCGKSNIIDAVRWVLGAQRPTLLRSDKMENVIFNGTTNRRALGMSEVQLTVENTRNVLPTEYSDVTIGRRLYRSGESEYLLNGVQCRLKDIEELFMDTGMGPDAYSVIELKMVDEILSNKGDSRRTMLEEAAGITKYKQRRRQALRKLETTQADLTRVRDITSELATQVKRLEKQAEKASEYKTLQRELRRLDLQSAYCRHHQMLRDTTRLNGEGKELENRVEELTTQKDGEEAKLEEQRTALTGREQHLATAQQTLNEQIDKIRQLESDVRLQEERRETAGRGLERIKREKTEAAERRRSLEETRGQLEQRIEDARPEVQAAEEALEDAESVRREAKQDVDTRRETLEQVRRKEEQIVQRRSKAQGEVDRLRNRIELLDEEHSRVEEQLASSEGAAAELSTNIDEAKQQLEQTDAVLHSKNEALEQAEKRLSTQEEALTAAEEKQQQLERAYDALTAEVRLLESLVSSYDEYGDTIKFLAESDWSEHGFQTVADVLSCDENDRLALNAALGPYRSCIVVETAHEAQQAIEKLRREDKGQATFLVLEHLDAVSPTDANPPVSGDMQPALELVRVLEPQYDEAARVLLANCFFVDTLEQAQEVAAGLPTRSSPARFIARSGEWVDAAGTIHGGGEPGDEAATAHRLGRREQLEKTREELSAKAEAVDRQTAVVKNL